MLVTEVAMEQIDVNSTFRGSTVGPPPGSGESPARNNRRSADITASEFSVPDRLLAFLLFSGTFGFG